MSTSENKEVKETIDFGDGTCFQVERFTEEEKEDMKKKYAQNAATNDLVKILPGKWCLSEYYVKSAHSIYNFKFRPDDTIVMTHPKSGTIWIHEIVWTMKNNPNLDNNMVRGAYFSDCPYHIEIDIYLQGQNPFNTNVLEGIDKSSNVPMFLQFCNNTKSPRVLTTHLPFMFYRPGMLDGSKVIYVARNPFDVLVSYYHFTTLLAYGHFVGSFDDFIDYFIEGKFFYSPLLEHVKQAWKLRNHPNLHFVFYEDFKRDPEREIRRMDKFLETNLTDKQINNVVFHSSFDNMKKMDLNGERQPLFQEIYVEGRVGGFFRKGESGGGKTEFSAEQRDKFSRWIEENTKDSDIKFKYN